MKVRIEAWKCGRCGHEWVGRGKAKKEPVVCSRCKSPYWNKPRKVKNKNKAK